MVERKVKVAIPCGMHIRPAGIVSHTATGFESEELGVNEDEITETTSFKEDLGADSLDLFELVTNLEEEYNIEIPAEELEKLTTVGKVIDYLKSVNIEA